MLDIQPCRFDLAPLLNHYSPTLCLSLFLNPPLLSVSIRFSVQPYKMLLAKLISAPYFAITLSVCGCTVCVGYVGGLCVSYGVFYF